MQATNNREFLDQDLTTLKDTIEALEEVLEREDFDEYDAGDVDELCFQIEDLAKEIKKVVCGKTA